MNDDGGKDLQARMYNGRSGVVEYIDSLGQLHGTWGGLAVIPGVDDFEVLKMINKEVAIEVFFSLRSLASPS